MRCGDRKSRTENRAEGLSCTGTQTGTEGETTSGLEDLLLATRHPGATSTASKMGHGTRHRDVGVKEKAQGTSSKQKRDQNSHEQQESNQRARAADPSERRKGAES